MVLIFGLILMCLYSFTQRFLLMYEVAHRSTVYLKIYFFFYSQSGSKRRHHGFEDWLCCYGSPGWQSSWQICPQKGYLPVSLLSYVQFCNHFILQRSILINKTCLVWPVEILFIWDLLIFKTRFFWFSSVVGI